MSEVERLRKHKKYGLVWEDKPEDVVEQCKTELPVLKEVKNKAITKDENGPVNILIEGDNYHALSVLNYTHKGKVDVIYIDPPYNRGGDFKFNDTYVDREDAYRHSKWLSFIEKRLTLARSLLKKSGVIFTSIDDCEFATLRMLYNRIFGEDFVDVMVWRKSGDSRDGKMKNTTTFRKDHEYVLICFKKSKLLNKLRELPNFKGIVSNPDNDPRGDWLSGSISRKESASNENSTNYYEVMSLSGKKFKRQWDIGRADFEKLDKEKRIYWGPNDSNVPRVKIFVRETRQITPYSVLLTKGTTTDGTEELNSILCGEYNRLRPKPSLLIKTLIQLGSKEDSVVLDFFAGSGTTGHAVLELNKKDGGNRQFILCTNNENNIATDVCYPRVAKVVKGYQNAKGEKVAGLGGNLKYFRTAFVKAEPNDKNKEALTRQATEMLCMREDTFQLVKETKTIKIFKNGKQHTGIVFDESAILTLKKDIAKIGGVWSVYIFSLADETFDEEFEDMKKITVTPIPEAILRVYRRLFQTT